MLKIKNWKQFQHFKNRNPPWIKLHRSILDQHDINMISDCSFRVLIGLWILASESKGQDGTLPPIPEIAFRLRLTEKKINDCLKELTSFVVQHDINMISERYQDGPPEAETEAYKQETEKEERHNIELDFEKIWDKYPHKVGKKASIRHYNASVATLEDYASIGVALEKYKAYVQMRRNNGQSNLQWQNASTWFNNWRDWIDYVPPADTKPAGKPTRAGKALESIINLDLGGGDDVDGDGSQKGVIDVGIGQPHRQIGKPTGEGVDGVPERP